MKKLLIVLFIFCFKSSFSQTVPDYTKVKLAEAADYKIADPVALNAAKYLLSEPFKKNSSDREKSVQFIMKWMTGTPDYTFTLDGGATDQFKGNDELLGLYMAAMTKYVLENKSASGNEKLVKLNAFRLLLAYCENPKSNMKMNKELQQLSEANKKGELEKELADPILDDPFIRRTP